MGFRYSPVTSPKSPLSPRTVTSRTAWWLAILSLSLSLFAVASTFRAQEWMVDRSAEGTVSRVVLRSFLVNPDASTQLRSQEKPLLVDEADLDEYDLGSLQQDQLDKEADARALSARQAKLRAELVQQLVLDHGRSSYLNSRSEISPEEEQHRQWIVMEAFRAAKEAAEYDDGTEAAWVNEPTQFEHEVDDIELVQPEALVVQHEQKETQQSNDDGGADETQQTAEWDTGRGGAEADEKLQAIDSQQIIEPPRPGGNASFLETLSTCRSLDCLRDAHARPRKQGQFNFPHTLLVGWQKSATTSLYMHLSRHDQVVVSREKEPEFFTIKCRANPLTGCSPGQQANYIEKTLQRDAVIAANASVMAFEASTHYAMNGDVLAAPLREVLPWVKVVASMREPISRAASMLVHLLDRDNRGCLAEPKATLYHCLMTKSQLIGHPGPFNNLDSLHGNYSLALQKWVDAFPRDQIYLVQYEVVTADDAQAQAELRRLKKFLGLNPQLPEESEVLDSHNVRKTKVHPDGWPMTRKEYQALIDVVRPDAELVAQIVEKAGQGSAKRWLKNWQSVWDANLASCNAEGKCHIHLS